MMGSSWVGKYKGQGELPDPFKLYAEAISRPSLKFDNDDPEHLKHLLRDSTEKLSDNRAKSKEYFEAAMKFLDGDISEAAAANLRQAQHYGWMALENLELENNVKARLSAEEKGKATQDDASLAS